MKFWEIVTLLALIPEYSVRNLALQWRQNGRHGVWNHQFRHYLFNRLFSPRSNENQSSASPAFIWGIYRWPVNSPYKGPVTRKMFPFDDVIMSTLWLLIPWQLQQQWYHSRGVNGSVSSMWSDISYVVLSVLQNDLICKCDLIFPEKNGTHRWPNLQSKPWLPGFV